MRKELQDSWRQSHLRSRVAASTLLHTAAHKVKSGMGARIISSPSGIISDSESRKTRVGGEELFEIW